MAGPGEPATGRCGPGHEQGRGVWEMTSAGHLAERDALSSVNRKFYFLPLGRRQEREKVHIMWCDLVTKKKKLELLIHRRCVGIYMYLACCLRSVFTGRGYTWSPQLLPPPSALVFRGAARRPVQGPAVGQSGARAQGWPSGGRDTAGLPEARWVWAEEAFASQTCSVMVQL